MRTYTFHYDAETQKVTCTDPKNQPVPLREVPQWAMRDVLENLHGLIINGLWHAAV